VHHDPERRRSATLDARLLNDVDRPVVVAMIAMRMMQVAVDQIVQVIAMRHGVVPASRTVHVPRLVPTALVIGRAAIRVGRRDFQSVFVHVIAMRVMQMAVVEIVDMIAVPDGRMFAGRAVLVIMMGVVRFVTGCHGSSFRMLMGYPCSAACARTLLSSVRTWSSDRA